MMSSKVKQWLDKQKQVIIKEFTSEPPKKVIQNILTILFGSFLFAIADSFFLIPMGIISGGVSSLGIILHSLPILNKLDTRVYILLLTWGFFLLGLFTIGLKYSLKQLVFAISYPLFNFFLAWLIKTVIVNGVPILDLSSLGTDIVFDSGTSIEAGSSGMLSLAYFVAVIFGGTLMGIGIGFTYIGGGSSGGTDVINILVNKFFGIRIGTSSFICDMLVITGGFFANGYNFLPSLCGILAAFFCSFMIDRIYLGTRRYYLAQIISEKWSDINDFINKTLGRGTTLLQANGGYTKKDITIVQAAFDKQDYALIKQSIYQIDPNAFVTVTATNEILGYGFSRATPKIEGDLNISPDDARKLVARAKRKRRRTFYYDED